MNRPSSRPPVQRPNSLATLSLLLFAALPGGALAQKPAAVVPPVPSPVSVPVPPPVLSQKEMLAQDSRLDRVLSLDVISVPLDEVLQKESLDKSTETMEDGHRFLLTAAPDCADLKLQVRLNKRPLRVLMQALAEMLPGQWTRTPHGYQLAMTKDSVNARADWWHLFLGEREKALAAQRQAVLPAMQTKGYRRKDSDPDPEHSDRDLERREADQHDFFQSLPPALKEQIAANMEDSGFYGIGQMGLGSGARVEQSGTIGWLAQMSPEAQDKFKTVMQNNLNQLSQAPPADQGFAAKARRDMAAFDPSKVYFLFQNQGCVVFATAFNAPPTISGILSLNVPITKTLPFLLLNQEPLVTAVHQMGEAAPSEWKRLVAYQHSHVWPNRLPALPPDDHTAWHPSVSRAAQTDWLGEQGHMEYVCDYYSHGGYEMPEEQKKLLVKRPLAIELDEMASRRDVSWTKDVAGIYLVRNNRWYRDDALEVPEPLLRRWFGTLLQARRQEIARQQAVAAQAATPSSPQATPQVALQSPQPPQERTAALRQRWDWGAEVFGTLTPWQIRNGLARFQPEEKDLAPQNDATAAKMYKPVKHQVPNGIAPPDFDAFAEIVRIPPFSQAVEVITKFPHTLQLYSSLDDAGRTALLEGHLSASALSTVQIAQAASLQPRLLQALQDFPPDSVLLGFTVPPSASPGIAFWNPYQMRLEVSTPQTASPRAP